MTEDWLGLEGDGAVAAQDDWLGLDSAAPAASSSTDLSSSDTSSVPEGEQTWSDHARSFVSGLKSADSGAGWLLQKYGELTDSPNVAALGSYFKDSSAADAAQMQEGKSPYEQAISKEPFLKDKSNWQDPESVKKPTSWGDLTFGQALDKAQSMMVESMPGTLAGMGTGSAMSKGLQLLPGVSKSLGAMLGFSGGEALVAAPSSAAQAGDEVRRMPEDQLAQHVEYQAMMLEDVPKNVAREKMARAAEGDAAALTALSTFVLSSPFGNALEKVLGGESRSLVGGGLKGIFTEGGQETLQSGAEQASINAAMLENADPNRDMMKDVPESMVSGGLAGAAMGGSLGAYTGHAEGLHQQELDRQAEAAAQAALDQGGDDLDAELARQQVYWNTPMPTDGGAPPTGPTGPDAPINFNPYQPGMVPMPDSSPEDFAPSKPSVIDEKSSAIQKAMEEYQQRKEGEAYDALAAGPERERIDPALIDSAPPTKPALQEVHEAVLAGLEAQYNEATKQSGPTAENGNKGKNALPMQDREILHAIASMGGLSREEAQAQGIDPAEFNRREGGIALVFKNGGKTFDEMAETLSQLGFFGDAKYSANALLDKVSQSLAGNRVFSPAANDSMRHLENQVEADRITQAIHQFEQDSYTDRDEPPKGPLFSAAKEEERRVGYAILEAELAGVHSTIIDHIVLDYDLPDADVESALKQAINHVKQRRSEAPGQAGQAAGNGEGNQTAPRGQGIAQEGGNQATQPVAGTQQAEVAPAANEQTPESPVFTGKNAFSNGQYGASTGSISEGNRRQLMVDPAGGYYWGDWNQESQRDVGAVIGGKDKDGVPAFFPTSKEAKEAAATTPQNKISTDFALAQETEEQRATREQTPKTEAAPSVPGPESFTLSTEAGTAGQQLQPSTGAQSDLLGGGFQTRGEAATGIDAKANAAASSPQNDRADPTPAQIAADNYKKGEPFTLHGHKIVIENPRDSMRGDKETGGKKWQNKMAAHYGDIKGTTGADGDALDVFVGRNPESEKIFIIDQQKKNGDTGGFDEHKVMMGFPDQASAEKAYLDSYDKGWGIGPVSELTPDQFKDWIANGDHAKPYSNQTNRAKLDAAAEKLAKEKAEKALADTTITEEYEDEDGNAVTVEQSALDKLRHLTKRIEVMDQLLGCLKG